MKHPLLSGNLVRLRAVEPYDLDLMDEIENDSSLWEYGVTTVPYSRFTMQKYIENSRHDLFADKQLRLVIVCRENEAAVGLIDLFSFSSRHSRAAVGITLLPSYRLRGYAREAVNLLCEYAFGFLHLKQLYVHIAADNEPSLRLFASCKFVHSGLLKEWMCTGGMHKDVVMMQRIGW